MNSVDEAESEEMNNMFAALAKSFRKSKPALWLVSNPSSYNGKEPGMT